MEADLIWLWRIPEHWQNKRIGKYIKNSGTNRFDFQNAITLDRNKIKCPYIEFSCSEKYLYDVLPNSGSLLVVSNKVTKILEQICPDDYQQFEANIYVNKNRIYGYFLLNIVNSMNVIDKEKSEFFTFDNSDDILGFDKIAYCREDLSPHEIVRNADYLSHVIVSDRLKEAFEKEKIKGVEFRLQPTELGPPRGQPSTLGR